MKYERGFFVEEVHSPVFWGGAEAQRTAICMAKASDFIQHGEGIFGLNYSGEQEFGAIISSKNSFCSASSSVSSK